MTGATGRLGRLFQVEAAQMRPQAPDLWPISRRLGDGAKILWDFKGQAPQDWPEDAVLLHLAGTLSGDEAALHANVTLAEVVLRAAVARKARLVLFASSVAVYRPSAGVIEETATPDPAGAYGRAKWQAEQVLADGLAAAGIAFCALRIANVAGADALLGGAAGRVGPVVLDPVAGQPMGPERSYIGPRTLARVVLDLAGRRDLPPVLNIAQPGAVAMGDLLQAAGLDWRFGPARAETVPRVVVDTARLQGLMAVEPATPAGLIGELAALRGRWP